MKGLYAQLDLSGAEASIKDIVWDPLPQPESLSTDFAAFLCTTRQCACRYGPAGWPLSGVGGWVWAKTPIHAVVLELSVLRECGLHEFGQLEKVLEHRRFRTWRPLCVCAWVRRVPCGCRLGTWCSQPRSTTSGIS